MTDEKLLSPSLREWQCYHQAMADRYKALLDALEAPMTAAPSNGAGSPVKRQRGKGRPSPQERQPLPLRAKREAAGVSVTALAKRLGISASYVGQVESGYQRARPEVPQHWEAVLDDMIAERNGGNE